MAEVTEGNDLTYNNGCQQRTNLSFVSNMNKDYNQATRSHLNIINTHHSNDHEVAVPGSNSATCVNVESSQTTNRADPVGNVGNIVYQFVDSNNSAIDINNIAELNKGILTAPLDKSNNQVVYQHQAVNQNLNGSVENIHIVDDQSGNLTDDSGVETLCGASPAITPAASEERQHSEIGSPHETLDAHHTSIHNHGLYTYIVIICNCNNLILYLTVN